LLSGLPSGNWTITQSGTAGNTIVGNTLSTTISSLSVGNYAFTVTNSVGCISASTGNITVNNIICPVDDSNSTPENVTLTVLNGSSEDLLQNDTNANGNSLLITEFVVNGITYLAGTTANLVSGNLTINSDGSYTFVPAPNFNGIVPTVTYTVSDGTITATANLIITVTPLAELPSIALVKTAVLNGTGSVGDTITYTLTVTNTGNVAINNITVIDALLSVNPIAVSPSNLLPGEVATATVTYTITQSDMNTGSVTNTAVASGFTLGGMLVTDTSDEGNSGNGNDNPTITLLTQNPSIAIIKTAEFNDDNGDGFAQAGETITYSFTVTNTGNVSLINIRITDPLPGVLLSGGPISLGVGQSDNTSFTATYAITQSDINLGSVTNQATVFGTSPKGVVVEDKSDYSDNANDNPTVLDISGCVIEVFNVLSANDDDLNKELYIRGLECYPENTVSIYNRWGVLVYEKEHYNNVDRPFEGISEGRKTIKQSEKLPEGTYFYILKYKDNNSNLNEKAGYLYINK
jgi:uncharacterized repeat protein (TIGR01451 family)